MSAIVWTLRILNGAVNLYSLLLFIRIISTWFTASAANLHQNRDPQDGSLMAWLRYLTDPWLNFFRAIPGLRWKNWDFSVILALMALNLLSGILYQVEGTLVQGLPLVSGLLMLLVRLFHSLFTGLLGILFFLILIRWLGLVLGFDQKLSFLFYLDPFLTALVQTFQRLRLGMGFKRLLSYARSLAYLLLTLALVLVLVNLLASVLAYLVFLIPL